MYTWVDFCPTPVAGLVQSFCAYINEGNSIYIYSLAKNVSVPTLLSNFAVV